MPSNINSLVGSSRPLSLTGDADAPPAADDLDAQHLLEQVLQQVLTTAPAPASEAAAASDADLGEATALIPPVATATGASAAAEAAPVLRTSAAADQPSAAGPVPAAAQALDPQTPPAATGQAGYDAGEVDALATLERHEGEFSKHGTKLSDIAKKLDDPNTPSDLKQAIQTVLSDPSLAARLDGNSDGKISSKDIKRMGDSPQVVAYNRDKAQSYQDNYIPSGDGGQTTQGRPITKQDAMQELYKYSDYLPKHVSQDELQKIVDGTGGEGKRPPQLVAAAKYFTDHPDEWKALNGGKDEVKTAQMEDNISAKGELTQSERSALDRLESDPNGVFKGDITRDSLKKLLDGGKADAADKQAAQTLLDDPVLFGKLDNGKNGRNITGIKSLWDQSDDGKISQNDLKSFEKKLQDKQVYQPQGSSGAAASPPPADAAAVNDMLAGEQDQPAQKKPKGGGFKKFLQGVLNVFSKIAGGFAKVLGWIAKILPPGLKQLAGLAATGVEAVSGLEKTGATAIAGGDWKAQLEKTGVDTAGTAINGLAGTSAGSEVSDVIDSKIPAST